MYCLSDILKGWYKYIFCLEGWYTIVLCDQTEAGRVKIVGLPCWCKKMGFVICNSVRVIDGFFKIMYLPCKKSMYFAHLSFY